MKKLISLLLTAAMIAALCVPAYAAAPLEGYPGIDELEASDTIPNPFQFFDAKNDPTGDGYVSSPEEWSARREEIKDIVQHYWLGYQWETAPENVSGGIVNQEDPNNYSFSAGWSSASVNLGEEFEALVALIQSEGVTVGEQTYGPETDGAKAQEAAVSAWNAGYTVTRDGFFFGMPWGTVDCKLSDAGTITAETIPARTKWVDHIKVMVKEGDVSASYDIQVSAPTAEQRKAAWGDENAQVPAVIDIGGSAAFSAANLNPQGYALITFTATDIYADDSSAGDGIDRSGVYTTLYPYDKDEYKYASGALLAWAWGVSQIITAMENEGLQYGEAAGKTFGEMLYIDPAKTVVTGHSRYGKAAMFAAAFDDRISICCPSEPGGSGIQSNRYKVEGKIFNWNTSYYPKADRVYGRTETPTVSYGSGNSWFPETAAMFVDKDDQIPFDSDEIIALVAPRPFFVVSGIDSHWLGNEGGVASVKAAAEVYDYIGADEIEKNNIAIRCRQSDHVFYPQDFCFALAIMDREFKQGADDTVLHVQDLFPEGENYSSMSYPAADYGTVSEMTTYPFEISSYYMPWSSANKYVLWTAQDNFLTEHDVTITAHSDAPDVDLYTPDGTKIDAAGHSGDEFTFQLTADQAVYGRYELRTVGTEKENRSVYFSAISLADALRHGTTKGDEGEENRVLGFSSRLANTADNAPEVYIDGKKTTMSFTASRMKAEETTLLSYGIQFHDPLFVRIANEGWDESKTFDVKNLQFVTLPGYTFEFSMADIYASAEDSGKEGADRFTKAISWPVERYNNGEADVWPQIPDTLAERQALAAGETVTRPDGPDAWTTGFDTTITQQTAVKDSSGDLTIQLTFSEPLNKGEYAFGMDVASSWTTAWNEAGTELTIQIPAAQLAAGAETVNLIIFRLMDLEADEAAGTKGNLLAGPIELALTITEAGDTTTEPGDTATEPDDTTTEPDDTTTEPDDTTTEPDNTAAEAVFEDVDAAAWYHDAVAYVVKNGLMAGESETRFAPDGKVTYGALVTALYRLAHTEEASYADMAAWAETSGIFTGFGVSGADDSITREQLVTAVYRYAASIGDVTADSAAAAAFQDAASVSEYAADAMNWAVGSGLVNGVGGGRLAPGDDASRAQAAAVLARFCALAAE